MLEIGLDRLTRHPFVRLDKDRYIAVFPLLKPQVERVIYSGKLDWEPSRSARLLRRMNAMDDEEYDFRETGLVEGDGLIRLTDLLRRRPLGELMGCEALLATAISHAPLKWNPGSSREVPAQDGDLRGLLHGLSGGREGAHLPTLADYEAICPSSERCRAEFACKTSDLIEALLAPSASARLDPVLHQLLMQPRWRKHFGETRGLPFLECGCWELTVTLKPTQVWTGVQTETENRPLAVGRTRYLPSAVQEAFARSILIDRHPCLGCRPVVSEECLHNECLSLDVANAN
jgi:hypothetical protein